MDKKDDTDPSLNTRRNSNQRRTPKFRGNFHGHSNRVRGNFSSHWSHRGGGGGRFDGSNQHQKNENNHNNCPTFNDQFSNYGISYKKIEDICNDLDNHKILSGSSELLTAVQVESFYHRLNDLWPDIKKQSNFLRVIVATASTNQADLLNLTYEFVTKIFESKIIDTIVEKCICPLMYDTNMQKDSIYAEISFHTVKLLLLGFHLLPSKMDQHLPKVQNVITSLKHISLKEETVIQLERLEIALKDRHETKASLRLTTQTQKQKGKIFEGSTGEPPINFRHISVVPIPEDISHQYPPYLRAAKFLGKYDSDEQYLDIQFRLLREDLIRPLRKGIEGYRKGGKKESDLFVFNDVELGASTIDKKSGELISFAHITISKRMRWDKRLKFGSLVCLSSDDFQKVFLFATVIEREELAKGKVGLKFEEISKINTKWKYKMVESPAFFEAYKHVMMALQAMEENEPIPFSKYLVNVETDTVPPQYIIDKSLNFKSLLQSDREDTEFFLHEIQDLAPEEFGMDESQFSALQYTLTSEFAILQGPPGTGKTYMGLQITKLLLDNWDILNPDVNDSRPMLVVCYTNHALDQFLEGICQFVPEGIIRVGGRCKNETIAQFNLSKLRKWNNSNLRSQFFTMRNETNAIQWQLNEQSAILKTLETRFASPRLLETALHDIHKRYFNMSQHLSKTFVPEDGETPLFKWLTQADKNYPFEWKDIQTIRQLLAWNIPEIKAKNGLAIAYQRNLYPNANTLSYFLKSSQGKNISSTQLLPSALYWPKICDIEKVKRLGFVETVAAEMLVHSSVNQIVEECNRSKRNKNSRKFAKVFITEESEAEIDQLKFKNDEEENRMIDDSNVLEDGFQVHTNKVKEVKRDNWFNKEILKNYFDLITFALPLTEEEANEIEDIWVLPLQRRWKLYQYWIKKCREEVKEKIKTLEKEYSKKMKMLSELRSLSDVDVLKSAKIVGMTTTGAAQHQSALRALRPRIVIVEEAAEVLEAHLITALTHACQHLILIGDHKQLRPSPAEYELAKKYNLEVSLFERLIKNGYPYRMLKNQHRMCTDISRVLMPHFYEDLLDDPSVLEKESVRGVTKNLLFINHSYPELTEKEFRSHKNEYEANFAIQLANYFLQQSYKAEQITILCTYLDQLLELRKMAYNKFGNDHGFVIQSVDNYQGEENDIVILSLVRSDNPENKIGFLKIPNRICVALSRARLGLYVLCNMDFLAKNCEIWNEIRESALEADALTDELTVKCQMHQNEQQIQNYQDFETKCSEGGCNIPCNGRLECGHQCIKPCHAEDMDHTIQKCLKPCERKCNSEFKHPCKKDCWKPCGDCTIQVQKYLPCQHQKMDFCFLNPRDVQCVEACQKIILCGHQCKETCGARCTRYCKELVEKTLPNCGHVVTKACSQDLSYVKCNAIIDKKWPFCDHTVETECSTNVFTLPCPHPCNTELPDCGHLCKGNCGLCRNGRLHIACTENCNKILLCEHECEAKCSKICPPCPKPCETACAHSQCGNQSINGEQKKKTRKLFNQKKHQKNDGRKCGEPCPPCMEQCLNRCEHRQCANKCGDPCSVLPCSESCMKILTCTPKMKKKKNDESDDSCHLKHRCIGVCGEECPKICEICNPDEFAEIKKIFFGNEDEENARFVQLKDCGHTFEVNGLDQWIDTSSPKSGEENGSIEIVQIKCPKCKTSIRRSKRYISILNERAMDMDQIKQHTRGLTNAEKKREHEKFKKEVQNVFKNFNNSDFGGIEESMELEKKLIEADPNILTKNWFSTSKSILRIIKSLTKYEKIAKENIEGFCNGPKSSIFRKHINPEKAQTVQVSEIRNMPNFKALFISKLRIHNFWDFLRQECQALVQRIHPFAISEPMIQQFSYEIQRFGFFIDLFTFLSKAVKHNVDFTLDERKMIYKIFKYLNKSKGFNDMFEKKMNEMLQNLAKIHPVSNFGISENERIEIVKALGADIRHWYKCPNGHYYGISDCGRAVITAKCPECTAQIGGESHRLLATNQDAEAEILEGTGLSRNPGQNPFEVQW